MAGLEEISTEFNFDENFLENLTVTVSNLLDNEFVNEEEISKLILSLHYSEVATVIETLPREKALVLFGIIPSKIPSNVLTIVDEDIKNDILDTIGYRNFAYLVSSLEGDDAVNVLSSLAWEQVKFILGFLPTEQKEFISKALVMYEDGTAGRLMQWEYIALKGELTASQTIQWVHFHRKFLPRHFYDIFIIDDNNIPVARVSLANLMKSPSKCKLSDLASMNFKSIHSSLKQSEVALLFKDRKFISAPVVNDKGEIVGCITVDDVVDVINEENEDDILRLGGVADNDIHKTYIKASRQRFNWLFINIIATFISATVIGLFTDVLERVVVIAALMPIIASMGGNAGTQVLTVIVRSIATKELSKANVLSVFSKEVLIGIINGILFALISGIFVYMRYGGLGLSIIVSSSMFVNFIVAAFFGFSIPIMLEKVGVDPAVASVVMLTMITDICGFFVLLGLASIFL